MQGCDRDWSTLVVTQDRRQNPVEKVFCEQHGYGFAGSFLPRAPLLAQLGKQQGESVRCEVGLLLFNFKSGLRQMCLVPVDGPGVLAIDVGEVEGAIVYNAVKAVTFSRPVTHSLMASIVTSLGGYTQDVLVDRFDENESEPYYSAIVRIEKNGELVFVDARPSDAIALAIHTDVPIFVKRDLLSMEFRRRTQ